MFFFAVLLAGSEVLAQMDLNVFNPQSTGTIIDLIKSKYENMNHGKAMREFKEDSKGYGQGASK